MITSKTKKIHYYYHLFLFCVFAFIVAEILILEAYKNSINWKVIMVAIIIAYPLFTIYTILSYPRLTLTVDSIIKTTTWYTKIFSFDDIIRVEAFNYMNKPYRIGSFCSLHNKNGDRMDIPLNFYINENDLLKAIDLKLHHLRKVSAINN